MADVLWDYYKRGKRTDLSIECGHKTFRVHALLFIAKSEFFKAKCDGLLQEECKDIVTCDDEEIYIEAMIEFVYTSRYTFPFSGPTPDQPFETRAKFHGDVLAFHIHMVSMGDKYLIKRLQRYATQCFRQHGLNGSNRHLDLLLPHVPEIYKNPAPGGRMLKDAIVRIAAAEWEKTGQGIDGYNVDEVLPEALAQPEFAQDLLAAVTNRFRRVYIPNTWEFECYHCDFRFRIVIKDEVSWKNKGRYWNCPECDESISAKELFKTPVIVNKEGVPEQLPHASPSDDDD